MANTYKSNVYLENANYRPSGQNEPQELTATILIPDGTALANGDIIKLAKIGDGVEIVSYELNLDQFDSNATAALKAKLGITASDACLLASTIVQTNTSGAFSIAALGGDKATSGGFATNPFPVQTTAQDVILTITQNAGTNYTTGDRKVTLRFKYQYAYPDQYVTGVTGVSSSNLLGTKVTSRAVTYTYNNQAP